MYNVEFGDGEVTEYTENVIAEKMYAKYDENGHEYVLLKQSVKCHKDGNAGLITDQKLIVNSCETMWKITKGQSLCIEWHNGS